MVLTVYEIFLLLHSYLRWPLLLLFLILLVRGVSGWLRRAQWRPGDTTLLRWTTNLLALQFLIGLLLYVGLSPWTRLAFEDIGAAMRDGQLRYYLVEHSLLMAVAVTFMSIATGRIRQAVAGRQFRATVVAVLITLVLIAIAIPWPGTRAGRPLFRIDAQTIPSFF